MQALIIDSVQVIGPKKGKKLMEEHECYDRFSHDLLILRNCSRDLVPH